MYLRYSCYATTLNRVKLLITLRETQGQNENNCTTLKVLNLAHLFC